MSSPSNQNDSNVPCQGPAEDTDSRSGRPDGSVVAISPQDEDLICKLTAQADFFSILRSDGVAPGLLIQSSRDLHKLFLLLKYNF